MKRLKIYLDNCCFNRPYDDQAQLSINLEALAKLSIQQEIREGKVDLVTSYILLSENAANRFEAKRKDIQAFIDKQTHTFVSEASGSKVKEIAKEIMDSGVKLMDACHIACAIIAGCDYFISTDKRLLKYHSDQIKIVNPTTYVLEREETK
ncbi:PIN domain-containing protein [bacterium]|nr:PIN domain-containing protein [bacterium]